MLLDWNETETSFDLLLETRTCDDFLMYWYKTVYVNTCSYNPSVTFKTYFPIRLKRKLYYEHNDRYSKSNNFIIHTEAHKPMSLFYHNVLKHTTSIRQSHQTLKFKNTSLSRFSQKAPSFWWCNSCHILSDTVFTSNYQNTPMSLKLQRNVKSHYYFSISCALWYQYFSNLKIINLSW